jgi:capsular polysaccharide biosynthesis protein
VNITLARVLLVVVVTLLVGAAALAFSEAQDPQYKATARFAYGSLLSPEVRILGGAFGEPDVDEEIRIATEAARVNSFDVARATANATPELGYTAGQIAARVQAAPTRGTLVVSLTATGSSAENADRLARAYADAYLQLLRDRERSRSGAVKRALRTRLNSLTQADQAGPLGAGIRNQLSQVDVLGRVGSGSPQLIESARASSAPAQPQTRRNVLFGLLFGLAVGVGLVALRSESRTRAAAAVKGT